MRHKKAAVLALILIMIVSFAACGAYELTAKGGDGVKVTVTFEKKPALQRCPHFTQSGDGILMNFNGTNWYYARIITKERALEISSMPLMAESTNIRVYLNTEPEEYDPMKDPGEGDTFMYLMTLDGTDENFVLFTTDGDPEYSSYWNDFGTCVTYAAGKDKTVPDTDFVLTDAFGEWRENGAE